MLNCQWNVREGFSAHSPPALSDRALLRQLARFRRGEPPGATLRVPVSQAARPPSITNAHLDCTLPPGALTCRWKPNRPHLLRRDFTRTALQSLTTLVLIEGLWSRRLLGSDVGPIVDDWFKKLNTISRDVHEHRVKDVEFQRSLEQLLERVDLAGLLKTLDFERLAAGASFPAKGAKSLPVDFSHVHGLPVQLAFGRQIFAMRQGRSVVPHGHDNMATGFLVLKGRFRGRHYDRVRGPRRLLHHPAHDRPGISAR